MVYGYDVETKMQSPQSMGKGPSSTKKTRMIRTKIKAIKSVFFYGKGIFLHEICTTWSDGKETVVPGNFSAFECCCVQEEA